MCLYILFLRERIVLSAKADFVSLAVVYVAMLFLSQRLLNAPLNSVPLSEQLSVVALSQSSYRMLYALTASGALFDRIETTLKNLDKISTATSKYLTQSLYFANIGDIY